jgi:TonB-dependent starch-binding outer membrane protein SusC
MKKPLQLQLYAYACTFMKISLVQLVMAYVLASVSFALDSQAQEVLDRSITLTVVKANLKTVLNEIEKQTRVKFVYSAKAIGADREVSLAVTDQKLSLTLEALLKPLRISHRVVSRRIVLSPESIPPAEESRVPTDKSFAVFTVQGKVTDEKGEGIPGVSIVLKGTTTGTTTDVEGNYTLTVPDGSGTLLFSYIGYVSEEILIGNQTTINVKLLPDIKSLSEIVVIGYGTREKKDLTGSVSEVTSQQIRDLPVTSIDQKLVGQIPGVQISASTGAPGGGTDIKIRGAGSIGAGNNPLYVVDGFAISNTSGQTYNPLNVISPDDIESVTVLKDASSTAIYGSRGSNGVIVITTKKGKKGPPVVSLNAYFGVQQVPQKGRPQVLNGTEYAQFRREMIIDAFAAQGKTPTDADIPLAFQNPSQYGAGTNWYDAVLRTALQNNVDASIRGGSDATQYSFSVGRLEQQGTLRYTNYERYTLQANVQSQIGKRLKVGLNLAPSGGIQRRNSYETGQRDVLTRTLWLSPIVPITNADGNRTTFITSPGAIGAGNPLNTLEYAGTNARYFRGLASAFAEFEIVGGLKAKYAYNIDYNTSNAFQFRPSFVIGETGNPNPNPSIPGSSTSHSMVFNWLSELIVSYDRNVGTDHKVNALLGYTAQKERAEGYSFNATNYPDNLVQAINAAALLNGQGASLEKWSLLSYLARVNYTFKEKYLFTGTIRTDGSSRFGSNVRYGTFPSVALGWRVSEEGFLKKYTWLNDLKIRGSYGLAGNFNIGNYSYASNISSANYSFGGTLASGRVSTSVSNQNLTWENSNELDLGVDVSLMNSRINLTLDYYNRITTGMLFNNEIPLSSGFSSALVNLGKVRNRGFEMALNTYNLTGTFTWNTNFNISFNRNEVLELNQDNAPIYAGRSGEGNFTHKTEVGKPIGQFFGYVLEGVYMNQEDYDQSPKNQSSVVGSIKYKDIDGNGIIEPVKDYAVIGNPYPDFTYGMTNTFGYKNFDFSVLVVGSQGGQILKTSNEFMTNIDGVFNVDRKVLNRWRSPENPGDGVTPTTNGGRVLYRDVNSGWVENASFLRIQNLTLGYHFKPDFISKSHVFKGLRLYGSVQNLVTFTGYSGGNPEALTNGSSVLTPGRDFVSYPLPRIMTIGANMTF